MNKTVIWKIVGLLVLILLTLNYNSGQSQTAQGINIALPEPEVPTPSQTPLIPAQTSIPAQMEVLYPEPSYTPDTRPYIVNKEHDIWHAKDPGSYITPDNEWVRYYASQLYIDYDGRIRYKNRQIPLILDTKGNVLSWTDEPLVNNYSINIYGSVDKNNIPWLMPDYYLTHGGTGVCSAWMATVTSLMLSGEISLRNSNGFVKQIVPAKAVMGYMGDNRDGWTEYQAYEKIFLTTTGLINTGIDGTEKISATEFVERKDKSRARPVFEFTDKYFSKYKTW